jgi:hypothetical protein
MSPIGKDPFDVMGLDADGSTLFASGHPSSGSKFPIFAVESIGKELFIASKDKIYRSFDQGGSWKLFKSFKGEVADISASSKQLAVVVGGEVFTAKLTK